MNEIVEACFAGVFYAEVIYHESERYTVRLVECMKRQGMLGSCLGCSVGDTPGNRMAVHSSVDLKEDSIVRYVLYC